MNAESDFYIGYLRNAPMGVGRFVRRVVISLGLFVVALAVAISVGQMQFAKSYFEFGKVRDFEGTLVTRPYPSLVVSRPGAANQEASTSEYLLVAPGKHGADDLVRSFDGRQVHLQGQLIYRERQIM